MELVKKIHFPLDSSSYLRKAKQLFKEGKNKDALSLIEKAYALDNDIQINIFYSLMLSHFERYEEALEVMNKEKELYTNNKEHAPLYAKILVENKKFIEAEYIIQKYIQRQENADMEIWTNLDQSLLDERKQAALAAQNERIQIKTSLRELDQYSQMIQMNKIRQAERLNLSELQEIVPLVLTNVNISGMVQRYLLELLNQKGDNRTYSFLWLNQVRRVCPADLIPFDNIGIVHEISRRITEKLMKYPDLAMRVQIEITNDLLLLYPYIEEIITDVDFWIDAYLGVLDDFDYLGVEQQVTTEEQQRMMHWIDYLHTIAQREKRI